MVATVCSAKSALKQGFYGRNILFVNLNHCAQLFIEQCADTGSVDVDLVGNQRGQIYIRHTVQQMPFLPKRQTSRHRCGRGMPRVCLRRQAVESHCKTL